MLTNGSTLAGAITNAALMLDATSAWTVTGDSTLSTLGDGAGVPGTTITNIIGNGHTATYDAGLTENTALGGRTSTLVNGGTLTPAATGTAGTETAARTETSGVTAARTVGTTSMGTPSAGSDLLPIADGALAGPTLVAAGRRR